MDRLKKKSQYTIPEYENYVCNRHGVIRNRETGIIMRQVKNSKGYYCVVLRNEQGQKSFLVHRVVAMLFVNNPFPGKYNVVNHINNIKTDNRAANLEWCDEAYNHAYQTAMKRARENIGILQKSIQSQIDPYFSENYHDEKGVWGN